ncbi:MAG TPA: putative toxin-antitoxin system toxin component, PIN family [Candidatus Angelobacter sp.]|nr:putative toxin-antitoxin system toxin component, PIN family [Candidatus Angelobacter sp.]
MICDVTCDIISVLRLVLDTDVLVAAIRSRSGASWQLVDSALAGRFTLLLSVALVLEYEAVLTRSEHLKVGLTSGDIHELIDALLSVAQQVRNSYLWRPMLSDPNDDMVLETAVNGNATALVTFNLRHFLPAVQRFNCRVLLPRDALQMLRDREQG